MMSFLALLHDLCLLFGASILFVVLFILLYILCIWLGVGLWSLVPRKGQYTPDYVPYFINEAGKEIFFKRVCTYYKPAYRFNFLYNLLSA